jgi:hypothetical protein
MSHGNVSSDFVHAPVRISLRPSRVLIVIPDYQPWHSYASIVMDLASKIWGGAGFIFVPHANGIVDPYFLRLSNAYDPDHVVGVRFSRMDLMDINPEFYQVALKDGTRLTREEILANTGLRECELSRFDRIARTTIADACNPFYNYHSDDEPGYPCRQNLSEFTLLVTKDDTVNSENTENELALSIDNTLTQDLAVLRASKTGRTIGCRDRTDNSIPKDLQLEELAKKILKLDRFFRERRPFDWTSEGSWTESLKELLSVSTLRGRGTFYLVIGDGCQDYYLAHGLDRLGGLAVWIPERWLSTQSIFQPVVARLVENLFHHQGSTADQVRVISTTSDISTIVATLRSLPHLVSNPENDGSWLPGVEIEDLDLASVGRGFLALQDDFDLPEVLPALRLPSGTIEFVNKIPPFLPITKGVAENREREWVIDFDVMDSQMVRGHGLRGEHLEIRDSPFSERVRSGRDGISVMNRSFGFVPTGTTIRQKLARPRLRTLGLLDWIKCQASAQGWTVNISDAGQKAASAERMWGSRESLAENVYRISPFFSEFRVANGESTSKRYPQKDGVALGDEGYLSFQAAQRTLVPLGMTDEAIRETWDRLLDINVLRRGLILKCFECGKCQWIALSGLSTYGICARCDRSIPITQVAWRNPVSEPTWFYDLHPIVRQLLGDFGDVPLLTGRKLQFEAKKGEAAVEIEFKKDGESTIELDLDFGTRDHLTVGECKTHSNVAPKERNKKIGKLVVVANMLQADRVILAAGDPREWTESQTNALTQRLDGPHKQTGRIRKVEMLSGLRLATTLGE